MYIELKYGGRNMLKTDRMVLTKPSISDLEELYQLFSKEEVNKFNPMGAANDIDETRRMIDYWLNDWETEGIGYYIARHNIDNAFIGYMGIAYRELLGEKILNIAYRIEPKFWRKGYTMEGVTAILKKVYSEKNDVIIRILTKKDNLPSLSVAKKLGFIYNDKFDNYPEKNDVYYFNVSKNISDRIGKV